MSKDIPDGPAWGGNHISPPSLRTFVAAVRHMERPGQVGPVPCTYLVAGDNLALGQDRVQGNNPVEPWHAVALDGQVVVASWSAEAEAGLSQQPELLVMLQRLVL